MRFQISEVQADGHWVPLTDYRVSDNFENVFTLIVGQNAVGKSRLLRKIVSNYIFSSENRTKTSERSGHSVNQNSSYPMGLWNELPKSSRHKNLPAYLQNALPYITQTHNDYNYGEVRTSHYSSPTPSNVIAVSTGRHDRFPSATHARNKEIIADYRYIGTDQFSKNSISSSLISLLEGLLQGRQNLHKLSNIFEYLGFAPYLDIKLSLDKKQYARLTSEESHELHYSSNPYLLEFLIGDEDRMHDSYSSARAFY